MLDAKDGFGKPVRRAGSQAPLILAKAENNRVFIYNTRYSPLLHRPPAVSAPAAAAVCMCAQVTGAAVSLKGVDHLEVRLFASRTGCEQRTPGRPPFAQAVPRCGRSAGRKGGVRPEAEDGCRGPSPAGLPTELGWEAGCPSAACGDPRGG